MGLTVVDALRSLPVPFVFGLTQDMTTSPLLVGMSDQKNKVEFSATREKKSVDRLIKTVGRFGTSENVQ